ASTGNEAFSAATRIQSLIRQDREKISAKSKAASSVLRVYEVLQTTPFLTVAKASAKTGLTKPTINSAIDQLHKLGIVEEITKRQRGRDYAYREYLAILSEGGEPLDEAGAQKAASVVTN